MLKVRARKDLIYADECYQIMGIIFKVFNELGYGHKECFYQKAIAKEFKINKIVFKEQLRYRLVYKGEVLGVYIFDFLAFDKIIIEIKQRDYFSIRDIKQIKRYLKATGLKLGILVHFTNSGVRYKRIPNLND